MAIDLLKEGQVNVRGTYFSMPSGAHAEGSH